MAAQLIVALDLPRKEDALVLARELQGAVPWCKVGMELFTLAGPDIIRELHDLGFHVFLDMKFYDIPHTVAQATKTAVFAAKVMELTDRIVREGQLTSMMITHNMRDAIQYGNRLIMLHEGHIILDISGEEKKNLTVPDLLEQFTKASGDEFANDRAILS